MPARSHVGEIVAVISPEQLKAYNDILDLYETVDDPAEFGEIVFSILDALMEGA